MRTGLVRGAYIRSKTGAKGKRRVNTFSVFVAANPPGSQPLYSSLLALCP